VIERLSDEELAYLSSVFGELLGYETALTDGLHSPGIRRARGARAMAEELRARRAADPTDEEREALEWLMEETSAPAVSSLHNAGVAAWLERRKAAKAALARVLGGGE
jgi:hypothetical protein